MITRPMLLDETGQKIKLALQRVKNKFLGTTTDPVTPGQAGSSGVSPVIQDDTGREIISALNDLADAVKPASKTEQGLVSTDDQEFAGTKTFPGLIIKQRIASAAAGFQFNTFDDLRNGFVTMNTYGGGGRRSLYRYLFTEYSLSSTTYEPLTYYESFRLPAPDFDRTASATYDILTTKNLTTTFWLESTGSQTYTLSNYHPYLVIVHRYVAGASEDTGGLYLVCARANVSSNGAFIKTISASNCASLSVSGATLTITTSATYVKVTILDLL